MENNMKDVILWVGAGQIVVFELNSSFDCV
jgi:hypothetical protein